MTDEDLKRVTKVGVSEQMGAAAFDSKSKAVKNKDKPLLLSIQNLETPDKTSAKKLPWYEGEFFPVVGTSVFMEVDTLAQKTQILGL